MEACVATVKVTLISERKLQVKWILPVITHAFTYLLCLFKEPEATIRDQFLKNAIFFSNIKSFRKDF